MLFGRSRLGNVWLRKSSILRTSEVFPQLDCLCRLWFSPITSWLSEAVSDAKFSEMFVEILKTCGKNAAKELLNSSLWNLISGMFNPSGPYDALICDLFDAARKGDPAEIDALGFKECVDDNGNTIGKSAKRSFLEMGRRPKCLKFFSQL